MPMLTSVRKWGKRVVRTTVVLFLQMDNCGRENKNHTVLAYLAWLVQEGVFHRIYIDFLPVGG
jgi:hypothetical protein